MFLQRPQHAAPRRGFSRPRAVKRVRRQRAGWIMISGMCQRLSSAQDGWPTLVGWTGKQLRYCWIARRPAGATPCASRLRADRGPAAHVPVTQNDIAPLFSNFSKQTRYAEASSRRARSNAPFRRSIGGMRSKRAGNTFFTPLSSDFRAVTKRIQGGFLFIFTIVIGSTGSKKSQTTNLKCSACSPRGTCIPF